MKQEITVHIKPRKKKKHFANYVVFISLFAVTVYTIVSFVLQFKLGIEPSPTLTTCFYSFFGVELASLALIKHSKSKYLRTKVDYSTQQIPYNYNQNIDTGGEK